MTLIRLVSRLNERGAFADLYASQWRALTMWDVLEHIDEPELAVQQATEFVFVSIPILLMPETFFARTISGRTSTSGISLTTVLSAGLLSRASNAPNRTPSNAS